MANGHGGYRQPTSASPVSGPGALSQRTDGPLRGGPPPVQMDGASAATGPDLSALVPFGAPTTREDQPITAGLPMGPGAGPAGPPPSMLSEATAERLRAYMPALVWAASQPEADPATKQYVRQLRGELG